MVISNFIFTMSTNQLNIENKQLFSTDMANSFLTVKMIKCKGKLNNIKSYLKDYILLFLEYL